MEFVNGNLNIRDQLKEYMDRSVLLSELSYFDFFLNTYDIPMKTGVSDEESMHKQGRRPVYSYLPHTGHDNHMRILRREKHETMVSFAGPWFPRADDTSHHALYCASALVLLKPWRRIEDLKDEHVTFEDTFEKFMKDASLATHRILDNIQYFYDCSDKAQERREVSFQESANSNFQSRSHPGEDLSELEDGDDVDVQALEDLPTQPFSAREMLYADIAMNIATEFKVFDETLPAKHAIPVALPATQRNLDQFDYWLNTIKKTEHVNGGGYDIEHEMDTGEVSSIPSATPFSAEAVFRRDPLELDDASSGDEDYILNEEQSIAYTIIKNRFQEPTSNEPLLMILTGSGGTGKTRILQSLVKYLRQSGK